MNGHWNWLIGRKLSLGEVVNLGHLRTYYRESAERIAERL